MRFRLFCLLLAALPPSAVAACGGDQARTDRTFVRGARHADVELPQLEIHADGVDRFSSCPAAGGATQGWVPKVPDWSAPAGSVAAAASAPKTAPFAAPDAAAPLVAADGGALPEEEISVEKRADDPQNAPSATEKAIRDTLRPFRSCYRRGTILQDGTHDNGRVAIVVRIGPDGRVAKTESYGACELSRQAVSCMMQVASRLRFDPPAGGGATIIIPSVFAPRSGLARSAAGTHDDYAAAAAVAVESARPDLHGCEQAARRAVRSPSGWGAFVIDLDENGRAVRQNIDPWDQKSQDLLKCASDAIGRVSFPKPPGGSATVRVRIAFNRGEAD